MNHENKKPDTQVLNENVPTVKFSIDGMLDLHSFRPSEVGTLVPDYLDACRAKGINRIRIVHGKGKGILREQVHRILERQSIVESFRLAGEGQGGWGATLVVLRSES